MDIKVIGAGCDKCDAMYDAVGRAVADLGLDATVEKVEDLVEIVRLGVMQSPALRVDGRVVSAGRVLKPKEARRLLEGWR